jgi:hypothetical protein
MRKIDLTGKRFGKLTVIEESGLDRSKTIMWLCKCDCGTIKEIRGNDLRQGNTISCTQCPINKYFSRDGYMVGLTAKGEEFYFDKEDFELIKKYTWCIDSGYVQNGNTKLRMHRLIMKTPKGLETDHVNHNTVDNRKSNLRICTTSENCCNRLKTKSPTTSKYKGVSRAYGGKWLGKISCNKVPYTKLFDTEIEAKKWRDMMALKLHKEFALTNDMI